MTALISRNHQYALKYLFSGDKMTIQFGYNVTQTLYAVSPFEPTIVGLQREVCSFISMSKRSIRVGEFDYVSIGLLFISSYFSHTKSV